MKIIRWLLSHSLFILFIVAVIYAYMFWGNLLGEDTPAGKAVAYLSEEFVEVKEFVSAVKAKQAQLSGKTSEAEPPSDNVADTDNTVAIQSSESNLNENPVIESPVTEKQADESKAVESTAEIVNKRVEPAATEHTPPAYAAVVAGKRSPVNESSRQNYAAMERNVASNEPKKAPLLNDQLSVASKIQSAPSVDAYATGSYKGEEASFVPAEVERELSNVNQQGQVIDPSQPTGAIKELWITARKSFYQRNYELSEKSYQQVIENTKNNYDAYGELGNVYFNQGKAKEAAAAYFEAAAILIKKGQVNRATSLLGLMPHLDKAKADELQQLIDAAR